MSPPPAPRSTTFGNCSRDLAAVLTTASLAVAIAVLGARVPKPPPRAVSPPELALTEPQAIALAVAMLPAGATPIASEARLVDRATASDWMGASEEDDNPDDPIWMVAVRAPGLTEGDAARLFVSSMDFPSRDDPVDGIFVAIGGQTGIIEGMGSIASGRERSYDGLLSLPTSEAVP